MNERNNPKDLARCLVIAAWSGAKDFAVTQDAIYATFVNEETGKKEVLTFNGGHSTLAMAVNNGVILGNFGSHIDTTENSRVENQGDIFANILANKKDEIYYGELSEEELNNMRESLSQFSQMEETGNLIIDNAFGISTAMLGGLVSSNEKAKAVIREGIEEAEVDASYSALVAEKDSM